MCDRGERQDILVRVARMGVAEVTMADMNVTRV